MALSYNTETFVNIKDDLKNQLDSGKLSIDNADAYLREKYNVTGLEYNNAATQALEAEKKYFKMKEEFEDSPTSFLGIGSSYIPAHLREQEESTFQSILNFPAKAVQSGVRTIKGFADLGEMVLPEAITKPVAEVAGDVDDALSGFKPYEALKTTFDPATTKAEEVTGELGALFTGGFAAANVIGKAAPVLKTTLGGAIPTVAGFTASDIIVTDKNQNLANVLIDAFPSTKGALETLAINPDDADSIKLLKKAGEGVGIGGLTEIGIKAIAFGYKALKGKNKAIVEDDILTPPKDDSGTITDVEVKELSDGSYQQKINIREPIKILKGVKKEKDSTGVTGFLKRWLTSRQGLPEQSYRAREDLENALQASTKAAQLEGKEFIKVLEKEYGTSLDKIPVEDLELVNDALGRVPAMGEDASDEVIKILKKNPSDRTKKPKPPKPPKEGAKPRKKPKKPKKPPKISDEEVLDNYTSQIIAAAKQRQDDALNKIPEGLKPEIERLRAIVDNSSDELIQRGLSGSKGTTVAIDNKAGLYLTTDYEIFTNPQWLKRVKDVANATIKEREAMTDKEALDVINDITKFVEKEYFPKTKPNPVQVKNEVNKIIAKFEGGEDEFFKLLEEGTKTINQPSLGKIITGRKYIPQEVRALLKEVTNPASRVMSTIDKQGRLIAEHQFLQDIRDIAVRDIGSDLFRVGPKFKPTGKEIDEGIEGITQTLDDTTTFAGDLESIANNYIRTIGPNANPLIGVFTTNSFKNKLAKGLEIASPDNNFVKAMHGLQALSSGAQTIASEATHLINLSGNVIFTFGNGNLMPWKAKSIAEGIKKMLTYSPDLNNLINKSGSKLKINVDEYKKLQEKGLVNSGVNQEYFFRSLDDALTKPDKFFNPTGKQGNKIKKAPGQLYSGLATVYRAEDDVFKVFNYYQELNKLRKAFPKKEFPEYTDEVLENMAADIVKQILPMYNRIPRSLKKMRSFPVVGAFPSFLVESFRVQKNTAIIGGTEFIKGFMTGNKRLMQNGAERLAGFVTIGALGAGYLISGNKKNSISEEDNKVIDYFSPIYDRNSTRSYQTPLRINPKNGDIETVFLNVSRNNPADAPAKFIKALYQYADSGKLTNVREINETVKKIAQVFDPLITESLALEPILNVMRNNKQGRKLYKDGATPDEIMLALGKELLDKNIPKTVIDIIRTQESQDSHDELEKKKNWKYTNLTEEERKNFSAANRKGFPNRVEDRIKRFYGLTQQTFSFNKALQVNVAEKMRLINSLDSQLRSELKEYQSGIKADMSVPKNVKEIVDKVDNYILKNYRAQKQLAESLHEAKKLTYFDRKKNKIRINDQKLRSILSSEGTYNEPELIRSALVYRKGNRGEFRPSLFSSRTGKTAIKTLRIPKDVVQVIQNRLAEYARRATPLIPREDEK